MSIKTIILILTTTMMMNGCKGQTQAPVVRPATQANRFYTGDAKAPLHFSRFFPRYKMQDTPPTPIATLKAAKRIAEEEGIKYVYLGNV